MSLAENTGYMLHHTVTALARQTDQVLQERLGIGLSQFRILLVLQHSPDVQQKFIADNLGQTEASISRQIKIMQQGGYLESTISPRNRREHITSLTRKGRRLAEEAQNIFDACHQPLWDAIGAKAHRQLGVQLTDMHRQVCKGQLPGRCRQSYIE